MGSGANVKLCSITSHFDRLELVAVFERLTFDMKITGTALGRCGLRRLFWQPTRFSRNPLRLAEFLYLCVRKNQEYQLKLFRLLSYSNMS